MGFKAFHPTVAQKLRPTCTWNEDDKLQKVVPAQFSGVQALLRGDFLAKTFQSKALQRRSFQLLSEDKPSPLLSSGTHWGCHSRTDSAPPLAANFHRGEGLKWRRIDISPKEDTFSHSSTLLNAPLKLKWGGWEPAGA